MKKARKEVKDGRGRGSNYFTIYFDHRPKNMTNPVEYFALMKLKDVASIPALLRNPNRM